MLEKGGVLPRDGSTLDVKAVFKSGRFKNQEPWVDGTVCNIRSMTKTLTGHS